MHLAFCSPISLPLFDSDVEHDGPLPQGFTYPFAYFLAMSCLHAGHRVSVVTSANDVPHRMAWQSRDGRLTVIVTPRRRTIRHSLDCYRREVQAMRAELVALVPDLIHAQWTYEHAEAALTTGIPTLVTARDAPWLIAWHFRQGYRVLRALYASLWVNPRIRHLSAVSEHIEHYYRREPFCRPRTTCVVPNGLERELFAPRPKQYISSVDAPLFLAISGWSRLKNLAPLIKAFAIVRERIPQAKLRVVGAAPGGGGRLEARLRQAGLLEHVSLVGHVPYRATLELMEREADIVVHPTLEESFSMVTLEAMAKGVPVIGGQRSGAVPWLLDHGQAGVVVDVRRPQALADAMVALARDPVRYAKLAATAHQRALKHFTLDGVIRKYMEAYQAVVAWNDREPVVS
jgi:glycosyltransferase involved in cell wall biosynthesis